MGPYCTQGLSSGITITCSSWQKLHIYKQYLTQYSICCVITVISQKLVVFGFKTQPPGSDYLVVACVILLIPAGEHLAEL